MKKTLSLLCVGALLASLLLGCNSTDTPGTTGAADTGTTPPAEVDFAQTDTDMFTDRDKRTEYKENECVKIVLDGNSTQTSDNSVNISGSTVTITKEATYLVSGTLTEGSLVVNAPEDAKLQIIFNGVSITSSSSAALNIVEADKVFLTLAEGSENTLANGGSFPTDDSGIDGALFSRQDLTLNGSGKLTVTSPAGHGIVSKDDLVFTGGFLTVVAASHGLDTNDSVRICNTTLNIDAGKDGIHAENTDDTSLGFVYISDGTITIDAEGDGISAGAYVQVADGLFDITAGGGYENGTSSSSGQYGDFPGFGGGMGGPGGGFRPRAIDTATVATTDATSMKGMKAGTGLLLSGGTYTVNSADDAFHSNDSLTVNGGTYAVQSGDDAFHAETTLTVTNCSMDVKECYEGLEAEKIYVSGGTMTLNCADDGLNASGGVDSSGSTGGRDSMFGGGRPGGGMMGDVNENAIIQISGGKLTIYAGGDGLDSNGNLTISGGHTTVYNPKSGDTSVLDSQNKPSITGGTYIGLGITTNMAETFNAQTSTQGFLACSVGKLSAGTQITVKDSNSNVVLTCTTEYSTALVILSSPDIVKGATYTITAGASSGQVAAS
ncbi:MAG: carbohydrate-binding domain-containing protein [Oscillospiraceae bacterium]|nr:carbohydrate-binding domain-containing protein [Oscillospiraceae bacterium]